MNKVVHIRWLDSGMQLGPGWHTKEEFLENLTLKSLEVDTVGILMDESDEQVVIAQSWDRTDKWYAVQIIAKQNVIEVNELR